MLTRKVVIAGLVGVAVCFGTATFAVADVTSDDVAGETVSYVSSSSDPLSQLSPYSTGGQSGTNCTDLAHNLRPSNGISTGYGTTTCTKVSSVSNVTVTVWELRGSNQLALASKSDGTGGKTPYTSPTVIGRCTKGLYVHTEYKLDQLTPDGGGPVLTNTTAAPCQ